MIFLDSLTILVSSNVFKLFLVIALGKLFENLRIKKFSLGVASTFIIAALLGALFSLKIPSEYQTLGLCIFIYAVGIESGPQFFSSLQAKGKEWLFVPLLLTIISAALAFAGIGLFPTHAKELFLGFFIGSMKSTAALAAANESLAGTLVTAGFGIVYPLSLMVHIFWLPLLPKIFRHDIEKLKQEFHEKHQKIFANRLLKFFRVTNPSIVGKPFATLVEFSLPGVIFTRYIEAEQTQLVRNDIVITQNAIIAAVGPESELQKLEILIGPEDKAYIPLPQNLQLRQFIVSNSQIAGKTLSSILANHHLDVRITRILRASVELCPDSDRIILLGDRITAIGTEEHMEQARKLFGNEIENIYKAPFAPIAIGIALGMLLGSLQLPVLRAPLGLTGGIILTAMFLSYRTRFLGHLWQIPQTTTDFLKQFGISIFFASIGTHVGPDLAQLFTHPENLPLIALASACVIIPVFVTYFIATTLLKKNPLDVLGLLAGSLNYASALSAINARWKTQIPNTAFAFAYPLSVVTMLLATQAISWVFKIFLP